MPIDLNPLPGRPLIPRLTAKLGNLQISEIYSPPTEKEHRYCTAPPNTLFRSVRLKRLNEQSQPRPEEW